MYDGSSRKVMYERLLLPMLLLSAAISLACIARLLESSDSPPMLRACWPASDSNKHRATSDDVSPCCRFSAAGHRLVRSLYIATLCHPGYSSRRTPAAQSALTAFTPCLCRR